MVLAAALALAGCGGSASYPAHERVEGPIGSGADGVWLFQPAGKPKNLVIFFHGQGGPEEATPANHLPWIDHLVRRGSIVVYPRYEMAYLVNPLVHAVAGIRAATDRVDADGLPVLAIGYSRGGGLVVEYAAVAAASKAPIPRTVMSVFPTAVGDQGRLVSLAPLSHSTRLDILIGDKDTVVGSRGARYMLRRLELGGFPGQNIRLHFIHSTRSFTADHLSPMQTSPAARADFWGLADRLLAAERKDS
jgi:acetyl esterase/lipase